MKLRPVLIFLAVVVVFAVSLNLFRDAVGVTSPWFALLAMLCFLGLAAFARPLFPIRAPRSLMKLRSWELAYCDILGVPAYGELLKRSPLRYLNPAVYLNTYQGDYSTVCANIKATEAAHFWAALLVVPYMIYAAAQHKWSTLAAFVAIQVLGNLYPILHLRLVRGRLQQLTDRRKSRHASP
jgi:hypothetical protein